jgi:undecaprenyl-diphosphatase
MTMRRRWALAGALFLLCASFAADRPVARLMADASPTTLRVFNFITWFGEGGVILYPAAAIVLIASLCRLSEDWRPRAARLLARSAAIFAVVAAAGLVNDALKILFGRARPHLWLAGDESGFHFLRYSAKYASFPSGHTATSVAAAVIFSALWPGGRPIFIAFAVLIATSRIILDAHYVSDVAAGALVGGAAAVIVLDLIHKSGWSSSRAELSRSAPKSRPGSFRKGKTRRRTDPEN